MTRLTQGLRVIAVISVSAFSRGRLAAGEGGGQLVELAAGRGQGGAVEPRGPGFGAVPGMGENRAALGAVDHAPGVMAVRPPSRCSSTTVLAEAGRAVRSGQSEAGTYPM